MTGFLVRRAADDSHAMRPDGHYHVGRIGRRHLEEFVELETLVSPDNPAAKIKDAADGRAHILSIAAHPETVALHVQDKRLVMLGNLATLSFAIHNGRPDVYEPTGEVVMQFGLKLIF